MNFEIEIYNQYKLDKNNKYNLCPICSHTRSPKGQKQKCLMTNWERGTGTCQHCKQVIQLHKSKGVKNSFLYYVPPPKKTRSTGSFHSMQFMQDVSFSSKEESNFSKYLERYFTRKQIFEAEQKFLIFSTNDFYQKSICYPYITEKEEVTGIKVMAYDEEGKRGRNKAGSGIVNWMHSIQNVENWTSDLCLFGLHQINERSNTAVHIVESEKTAFVMSIAQPEFIWLATGGLTMLNKNKLEPLKDKKIILHPDKGKAFLMWTKYAEEWKEYNIVVSRITEDNSHILDDGDLADYCLQEINLLPKASIYKTPKSSEAEQDAIRSKIIYSPESIELHRKRTELKLQTTTPTVFKSRDNCSNIISTKESFEALKYFSDNDTDTF
jgi:hypothetical protein